MPEIAASGRWRIPVLPILGLRTGVFIVAFALGALGRFFCGWGAPFWFDETFSGVIAGQPSFGRAVSHCLEELSGPLYYLPLWVWEKLAGSSDTALRLPSIAASMAAPLVLVWRGHRNRDIRFVWGTLAALWGPGLLWAGDARPYSALFLYACIQGIFFLRLMRTPTLAAAFAWTSISVAMVLTHYHSLVVTGFQGLMYLALHRRVAVRSWPALAPFVPAVAWMSVHLPIIASFAKPGAAWFQTLPLRDVWTLPQVVFGSEINGAIILALIAYTLCRAPPLAKNDSGFALLRSPEVLLALSGIGALAIIFGMAFIRPSFTMRYLTSAIPALLFGIALWAQWMLRQRGREGVVPVSIVIAVMALMAMGAIRMSIAHPETDIHEQFNLEKPSQWLLERQPTRLIFFWDDPTAATSNRSFLAEVGGYFLARAGHAAYTMPLTVMPGIDPNAAIVAKAGADPSTAILWIVSKDATHTLSRRPRLAFDLRWECRDFRGGQTWIEACRRPIRP